MPNKYWPTQFASTRLIENIFYEKISLAFTCHKVRTYCSQDRPVARVGKPCASMRGWSQAYRLRLPVHAGRVTANLLAHV